MPMLNSSSRPSKSETRTLDNQIVYHLITLITNSFVVVVVVFVFVQI